MISCLVAAVFAPACLWQLVSLLMGGCSFVPADGWWQQLCSFRHLFTFRALRKKKLIFQYVSFMTSSVGVQIFGKLRAKCHTSRIVVWPIHKVRYKSILINLCEENHLRNIVIKIFLTTCAVFHPFRNLPNADSRDDAPLICYCSGGLHHHHLRCLSSASKLDTWEVKIRYSFNAIRCTFLRITADYERLSSVGYAERCFMLLA